MYTGVSARIIFIPVRESRTALVWLIADNLVASFHARQINHSDNGMLHKEWNRRHVCWAMLQLLTGVTSSNHGWSTRAFFQSYGASSRPCTLRKAQIPSRPFIAPCQPSSCRAYSSDRLLENVITSPKSSTVKKFQAISSKRKKRLEYQQTIVEGPRMVFDLLQDPQTKSLVHQILISTEDYNSRYREKLMELMSSEQSPHVLLSTPEVIQLCSDTVTPQGIVSLVDIPQMDLASSKDAKYPFYLVLDGVSDPGNVGTLLRSSLAVGASGVLLLPGCCDVWNPKAVRSAMGATFQLPIVEIENWGEAVEIMTQDLNVKHICAATMIDDIVEAAGSNADVDDSEANVGLQNYAHYDVDWRAQSTALVIGSEGNGLSPEIRRALAEQQAPRNDIAAAWQLSAVHVPMQAGIESLNAAVCGSVIMFEYARQCNAIITR